MRWVVLVVILAVALMFLGGWLYYRDTGTTSEIILDRQEVKQDTESAAKKTQEVLEEAGQELQVLGEKAEKAFSDDGTPPAKKPNEIPDDASEPVEVQ